MPPIELTNSAKIALAISAAFPLGAGAAPAGRIDFAVGNVTAKLADGSTRPLAKGAEINAGETIDTGEGRAQVRYTDGSQVSLRPGTQYRIDDYKFSGKNDGEEKAFFSLLKGGFRTITGLIGKGNREAYKVTTATATIGIRGTEFNVISDQNGITISTGEGLVQVCNAGGCIVLASGESAVVADKDGKPVRVINKGPDSANEKPSTPSVVVEKPKENDVSNSLTSGPGYAMAWAGRADSGEDGAVNHSTRSSTGTANFSSGTTLTSFSISDGAEGGFSGEGGLYVYGKTLTAGGSQTGFTDGTIGWGSWTSGQASNGSSESLTVLHYVIGKPTLEMPSNVTGTYTWLGGTAPTGMYGGAVVSTQANPGALGGSLTADFGEGSVSYQVTGINVPAGGAFSGFSGSVNGSASISGFTFSGSSGTFTGCSSGCTVNSAGLFVGANAARAGLSYSFSAGGGVVQGAAAFKAPSSFSPSF